MGTSRSTIVRRASPLLACLCLLPLAGCFAVRGSSGGGQTSFTPPRSVNAADVALPPGYRIEAVATGLTFPTAVAFDDQGRLYVTEAGYSYGEAWTTASLLRINPGGPPTVIASSENGPWNGVTYHQGSFYIAEGGEREGGRILRVSLDGKVDRLVEGLPSFGDHHTDGPVVGPDGYLYFGQGTATNSGVVGLDNAEFGWLKRHPDFHDIPAKDITLAGQNFTGTNPLGGGGKAATGAYSAFGTPTTAGQVVKGQLPCTGAILRVPLSGGKLEMVAWGLRNPYGLAFSPDGQLYVTENSYDVRGSRPIYGTGDLLWHITPGLWYGWPDYFGGEQVGNPDRFQAPGHPNPTPVLAQDPNPPPKPAARLGVHASADGFDFSRGGAFGHGGEAFVAEFGDMAPKAGKLLAPVGYRVVRVDVNTGIIHEFAANRGNDNGPASKLHCGGLERPVSVKFDRAGESLYVVDFGVMTMSDKGPHPYEKTGVVWRISREGTR